MALKGARTFEFGAGSRCKLPGQPRNPWVERRQLQIPLPLRERKDRRRVVNRRRLGSLFEQAICLVTKALGVTEPESVVSPFQASHRGVAQNNVQRRSRKEESIGFEF